MNNIEDNNTSLKIRILAARSNRPYSEYVQDIEDLITCGYTLEEAVEILKEKE